MKNIIIIVTLISLSLACKKKCVCNTEWVKNKVYYTNELVKYHDTCWVAVAQGAVNPGLPWITSGNDIWKVCDGYYKPI
jgi:hypothetical protein